MPKMPLLIRGHLCSALALAGLLTGLLQPSFRVGFIGWGAVFVCGPLAWECYRKARGERNDA